MRRRWDVLIAGAGPAGSVTAMQLARRGISVLLVDKAAFPRWKVCGCCLNGATLDALRALGLGPSIARSGAAVLREMRLAVGSSRATLPLREGVALSREVLDSALIDAAVRAGATFLDQTDALLLPGSDENRAVRLRHGGEEWTARAQIAIAADGLGGTFLRRLGEMEPRVSRNSPIGAGAVFEEAPEFYEPGTIFMACGRGAYVGVVRLEDGRLDVAAAIRRSRLRRSDGIGHVLRETLHENGFPLPHGMREANWKGTPPLTRARDRMAGRRLFVVGDSAGYVEPFTGEGISWAIQAGGLLARHLPDRLDDWSDDLALAWESRYRRFFRRHNKVCLLTGKLLRYRFAARAVVALVGRAPGLASGWVNETSLLDPEWETIAGGRLSMKFAIRGMGTARPENSIRQADAAEVAKQFIGRDPAEMRGLSALFRRTRIRTRGSVLLEGGIPDGPRQSFFQPATHAADRGPGTGERMQRYAQEALPLALSASRRAFDGLEIRPTDVTHLVTVSCSGFFSPGVDIALIKQLDLKPTVGRLNVGFMGCHGALNGLRAAQAMGGMESSAVVLLCAVELCSLHYQYGADPEQLVANAIFADGAAALVGQVEPVPVNGAWRLVDCGSCLIPETEDEMTWCVGDHGFRMTLSARVPSLIQRHLKPWLEQWLARSGRTLEEIRSWAVHPGGPRILSSVVQALDLPREATSVSEQVLSECGNMSSPTVLFVLDRLRRQAAPGPTVALAFGPGLVAEAALFD